MSLENVRPYFRTHLKAQGFKEWKQVFNPETIPDDIVDLAFHIESGPMEGIKLNQSDQELACRVTLRLYFQAFDKSSDGLDRAMTKTDAALLVLLKASNRLTGNLKNVILNSVNPEAFDPSNPTLIAMRIEMTARVIMPTT